jgi:hypothetical protein
VPTTVDTPSLTIRLSAIRSATERGDSRAAKKPSPVFFERALSSSRIRNPTAGVLLLREQLEAFVNR